MSVFKKDWKRWVKLLTYWTATGKFETRIKTSKIKKRILCLTPWERYSWKTLKTTNLPTMIYIYSIFQNHESKWIHFIISITCNHRSHHIWSECGSRQISLHYMKIIFFFTYLKVNSRRPGQHSPTWKLKHWPSTSSTPLEKFLNL